MFSLLFVVVAVKGGSHEPYQVRMTQIDANLARLKSIQKKNESITKSLNTWYESKKPVSDIETFGIIYKLAYKTIYLCYGKDRNYDKWMLRMSKDVEVLQPSIEKDICLSFTDQNRDGWLIPNYPAWKKSPLIATIVSRKSALWCIDQDRLATYKEVYSVAMQLKSKFPVTCEAIDAQYLIAQFQTTHDKKYIREFIDQTRKYVSHTPDPDNHKDRTSMADRLEKAHFKKG